MKLKELGKLVQIVKASGSHPNGEDLLTVSRNLSDDSLCCYAKMQ